MKRLAPNAPVFQVSALHGDGIPAAAQWLAGKMAARKLTRHPNARNGAVRRRSNENGDATPHNRGVADRRLARRTFPD